MSGITLGTRDKDDMGRKTTNKQINKKYQHIFIVC